MAKSKKRIRETLGKLEKLLPAFTTCTGEKPFEQLLAHWLKQPEGKLQKQLGKLLEKKRAKLSCAESCTGGYLSQLLTGEPASAKYFNGGLISYTSSIKISLLGVKRSTIKNASAESEQCAREMLSGA